MKKGDRVTIRVPGSRQLNTCGGRVQELVPPNCAKVYVFHTKAYFLIKLEHLEVEEPNNAAQENLSF